MPPVSPAAGCAESAWIQAVTTAKRSNGAGVGNSTSSSSVRHSVEASSGRVRRTNGALILPISHPYFGTPHAGTLPWLKTRSVNELERVHAIRELGRSEGYQSESPHQISSAFHRRFRCPRHFPSQSEPPRRSLFPSGCH